MTVAQLGALASTDLAGHDVLLLVPLGATEQHGPHLPLDTDTRIAEEIAHRGAARLGRADDGGLVVLAPPLSYGASGEHEAFAGTVSIGHDALHAVLLEYGRSACRWARRLVFVNGHGGNLATLAEVVATLRYEGRDAGWFACAAPGFDAHAGHAETSMLLAFAPEAVDLTRAVPGNSAPLAQLLPELRRGGVAAVSPNGILGDPTAAAADHGEALLATIVDGLVCAVDTWEPTQQGRLS
ncbi:mycofactocin biosynthesis peptidyl-dipeptidase MftE [Gordonia sp. X0973]|uniref:mycofactocin biosynthesis peptidyl-dipeptidase MftE n=1 Tax=Gordonia sp. X0973 TaxID=2742602 RepID=UPI000F5331A1|nr:mycofactocin biosynthesis peptidyl-dipeptidase MftE [Gordonia sp. X0973]QKT08217.1 mycofactocin biosynthesis peptidyl-dipeptidase MftE [Gordonia sp. X0973]